MRLAHYQVMLISYDIKNKYGNLKVVPVRFELTSMLSGSIILSKLYYGTNGCCGI